MRSLAGKKILLTGAAGGLGREFTRQLLQLGAELILTDLQEQSLRQSAQALLDSLPGCPGRILAVIGSDLSTPEGCEQLYQAARKTGPAPDILINNAGIITFGDFQEVPEPNWEKVVQLNLLAAMRLTYRFLPGMLERGQGQIVNVCSIAGIAGTSQSVSYSAAKFGMRGFGISLQGELKKTGLKVSNIYPLWIKTPLLETPVSGRAKIKKLSRLWTYSPERVVAASIKGIRRQRAQIYPGFFTKFAAFFARLWPIAGKQAR